MLDNHSSPKGHARFDVAVIGAGPVGAAAAFAFASRGRKVCLLEANPNASARFAGEWLHPPGKRILEEIGLDPVASTQDYGLGRGFVVHPDDGSDPITLPYTDGETAVMCHHEQFVAGLREQAASHPNVDYRPYVRASKVEPGRVLLRHTKTKVEGSVCADLIVGADGRSSAARRALTDNHNKEVVSFMAALMIRDLEMPDDDFGQVILGGPGPLLMYRISPDVIRVSIDVPTSASELRSDPEALFAAYGPSLPDWAREPVRRALLDGPIQWAAALFRPHVEYGRHGIALVGDAAGSYHPMTAVGMTSGFQDVARLVEATDIRDYRRNRLDASHVPELLSSALYRVFQESSAGATPLRRAVYETWRNDRDLCERTMGLLSGSETRATRFAATFLRIAGHAALSMGRDEILERGPMGLPAVTTTLAPWVRWPLAPLLPRRVKKRLRRHSTIESPMALRRPD